MPSRITIFGHDEGVAIPGGVLTRQEALQLAEDVRALATSGTSYDPESRTLVGSDSKATLTAMQGDVFGVLLRHRGRLIGRDRLHGIVYGAWNDPPDPRILDIYVHNLRKSLRETGAGWSIKTVRGAGWIMQT